MARDMRHCRTCDWPGWQHTDEAAPIIRITDHAPVIDPDDAMPRVGPRFSDPIERTYDLIDRLGWDR